ncbi:MAG: GAF domain-containing protein [Leptospiraceae bacterium]|nr:GAF domain-containing protein [Leptospiraceae bacterium]
MSYSSLQEEQMSGNSEILPPGAASLLQRDASGRMTIRASALQKLVYESSNLNRLVSATQSIMAELDLDALLGVIMNTVTEVMHADRSTLFLIDRERDELWSRVAQGSDEIRIRLTEGISGYVATTGQTVNIEDAYEDERFSRDYDLRTGYRTRSILCVPIYDQSGEILGTIQVLNKLDRNSFSKSDVELLAAFASLAGISLVNARAFDELKKARDFLEVRVEERTRDLEESRQEIQKLNEFTLKINALSELDEIVGEVFGFIDENFDIDGTMLILANFDNGEFVVSHLSDSLKGVMGPRLEELQSLRTPLSPQAGTLWKVYAEKRRLYLSRIPGRDIESGVDRLFFDALNLKAFLMVPLIIRGEVIGISCFTSVRKRMKLNREELDSIGRFCNQIAGAVYNSSLLEQVKQERARAESLLLSILPEQVATELKQKGSVTPASIGSVSVLFTDFVGFTGIAERMSPWELIRELDGCFSQFDEICRRNGLEKLKTIGDAYMCAGGLPTINHTHPVDACLAALELLTFMQELQKIKTEMGHSFWRLRIGVHTGPVTAGVIGKVKFAYDIWGDTVNIASRMESSAEPDRINISGHTYEMVKDFFECEYRGKVAAKNKGELDMYFLNCIREELSADSAGHIPNESFRELYRKLQTQV